MGRNPKTDRRYWTPEEDALLLELSHQLFGNNEIGIILGRTNFAVKRRKCRLKLKGVDIPDLPTGVRKRDIYMHTYMPKILLFDLETSPMECAVFQLKTNYINPSSILKPSSMLSWSAKWLCHPEVMGMKVSGKEAIAREDKSIVEPLWKLLDEADILIAHNLKGFDIKYANTRFILNGLAPPSPYRMVDTLTEARKHFRFASNKLDYLTKLFEVSEKLHTDLGWWLRCIKGDDKTLSDMLAYNKRDVVALEDMYLILRGWIKGHPNLAMYYEDANGRCPNCGNKDFEMCGKYYTPSGRYKSYRCDHCKAVSRDRYQDLTKKDKEDLKIGIAV